MVCFSRCLQLHLLYLFLLAHMLYILHWHRLCAPVCMFVCLLACLRCSLSASCWFVWHGLLYPAVFFQEREASAILQDIAKARQNIQQSLSGVSTASITAEIVKSHHNLNSSYCIIFGAYLTYSRHYCSNLWKSFGYCIPLHYGNLRYYACFAISCVPDLWCSVSVSLHGIS